MYFEHKTLRRFAVASATSVSWLVLSPTLALAQPAPLGKGVARKLTAFERGHIKGRAGILSEPGGNSVRAQPHR
jgi:hypothetical protein